MTAPVCRRFKADGLRCHSPALRGRDHCFYHGRTRPAPTPRSSSGAVALPAITDLATLNRALGEIIVALAAGRLDADRAGTLLYGVQLAGKTLGLLG